MKRLFTLLLVFTVSYISAQPKIYTPSLLIPNDAATNQMPDVTLSWSAVTGVGIIKYKLVVDDNPDFTSPMVFHTEFLTGMQMSKLHYNKTYFWRVKAYDLGTEDSSYWSATRSFSIFEKLENKKPNNKDKELAPMVTLEWKDRIGPNLITGNTYFNYMIDTAATFDSPLAYSGMIAGTSYKSSTPKLHFGTSYFWKVRALHEEDTSAWTEPWYFRTLDTLKLKDPANNATNLQFNLKLSWDKATGISRYDYEIANNPDFEDALHFITEENIVTPTGITFGEKYYWRVRGRHTGDTTTWGNFRSFSIIAYPNLKTPANNATGITSSPEFIWDKMTGLSFFLLQYDTDPNFTDGFISNSISDTLTKYRCPYILEGNTTYYWRMCAVAGSDTSAWSPAFSFTTASGVGIKDPEALNSKVFPNPARHSVSVRLPEQVSGIAVFRLMDLLGQKVLEQAVEVSGNPIQTLDLTGIRGGIYMLKIETGGKSTLHKLVIDK